MKVQKETTVSPSFVSFPDPPGSAAFRHVTEEVARELDRSDEPEGDIIGAR